ncbi:ABC transporter ATP-binding protein [Azospirillum brasilense]|uniref:ABC transporter ATP-binding protein n=1 Tax=Azospirillum brasilense TaxID=192 RepID=A0A6L3ARS6_AZOBR|nr:ABC transporter ATP-binding protein [Azospirillum brasilense]KAA0677446.1 ABC transporter ATP-binding protein [Azospirillum brasilense]
MSSDPMSSGAIPVIEATGLGKVYHIYDRPELMLRQMLVGNRKTYYREFWALRDVDFSVHRGETVGFLGRNGAGKSTLLQLVCGTLTPSEGQVVVRGRISALLELGSGFNPELSGHDNVYIYGALLGLSRKDIDERYDRILGFADIGQFINLPVKTYSSGMMVRLAFAVAINVDPEILVVDEALAVGDARFSARCMTQIRRMQESGASVLFVGHDTQAVTRLCSRAFVLHDGRLVRQGQPGEVASWYLALSSADFDLARMSRFDQDPGLESSDEPAIDAAPDDNEALIGAESASSMEGGNAPTDFKLFRYGDGTAAITSCSIRNLKGQRIQQAVIGSKIVVEIAVAFHEERFEHLIGFYIKDRLNIEAIGINTHQEKFATPFVKKGDTLMYSFEINIDLRPGFYSISPSIAYNQTEGRWMDYIENATIFQVIDKDPGRTVFGVCLPSHRVVSVKAANSTPAPARSDAGLGVQDGR